MGHLIFFWNEPPYRPRPAMPQLCRDPAELSGNEGEADEKQEASSSPDYTDESASVRGPKG